MLGKRVGHFRSPLGPDVRCVRDPEPREDEAQNPGPEVAGSAANEAVPNALRAECRWELAAVPRRCAGRPGRRS